MRELFKQIWGVIRDRITYIWLVNICDMPEVFLSYGEQVKKELGLKND